MPPIADLTTLTHVRRTLLQRHITDVNDDVDDDLLTRYITGASALIASHTQRSFTPYRAARLQDYYSVYDLNLDADLLEVLAVTNGNGAAIDLAHIRTQPANDTPKWRLSLSRGSGTVFTWENEPEQALEVEGVWGYHTDYPSAWVDTLADVPGGGITSSATSMTTPDATGMNAYGAPRFEVGGLYRINDEFIKVVDIAFGVDPAADTLTIRRAQSGTSAAAHNAGADIKHWQVLPDIEWQATRLVVWAYQRRDTVQSVEFIDSSVVLRDETLRDIFAKLDRYQSKRIHVA